MTEQPEDSSRRNFLKKAGLGMAAGLAAMVPSASGALKITKNGIFNTNETDTEGGTELVLDKRSSAPSNPDVGQIWYDTNAD